MAAYDMSTGSLVAEAIDSRNSGERQVGCSGWVSELGLMEQLIEINEVSGSLMPPSIACIDIDGCLKALHLAGS